MPCSTHEPPRGASARPKQASALSEVSASNASRSRTGRNCAGIAPRWSRGHRAAQPWSGPRLRGAAEAGQPRAVAGSLTTFAWAPFARVNERSLASVLVRQRHIDVLGRLQRVPHAAGGARLNKSAARAALLFRRRRGRPCGASPHVDVNDFAASLCDVSTSALLTSLGRLPPAVNRPPTSFRP